MGDTGGQHADRCQFFPLRNLGLGDTKFLGSFFNLEFQGLYQFLQFPPGVIQCLGHGIERTRDVTELIVTAHRNIRIAAAGSQFFNTGFKIFEGKIDQTLEQNTNAD